MLSDIMWDKKKKRKKESLRYEIQFNSIGGFKMKLSSLS